MITVVAAIVGIIIGAGGLYFILRRLGRRRTAKTLDIVLVIVYLTFIAFCATMIVMYWRIGSIPESFAVCVVCALIGEVGCTTRITNVKNRREDRKWQKEDEAEGRKP